MGNHTSSAKDATLPVFEKVQHKYGLVPERRKDFVKMNHIHFSATAPTTLPPMVDLSPKFPPCYDQGPIGSCTANALVGVFQFLDPTFLGSRLFLYYNERARDGDVPEDGGSTLSCGVETLHSKGLASDKAWPYVPEKFTVKPTEEAYQEATAHKVSVSAHVIQEMKALKACLASGYPMVVGIMLYNSFESEEVAKTGLVPMPDTDKEELLGGHAVALVGYDDERKVWIMRNSWGSSWGHDGYFFLPYEYLLTDSNLASDFWVVCKVTHPSASGLIQAIAKATSV